MSNIQTGAERMPHDLSHLGFLAGQIGRLITISTTPVIAGDSFEMDAVGALRLSPLRRGLAIEIGRAVQQECRDRISYAVFCLKKKKGGEDIPAGPRGRGRRGQADPTRPPRATPAP